MFPLLFGLSAEYPVLQPALGQVLSSPDLNSFHIVLPEGYFSDVLPVKRVLCTLSASDKTAVLTFQTRKKRTGFFTDPARQADFCSQIRKLLLVLREIDGIAGIDFDFSSESDPGKDHPFFTCAVSLFTGFFSPDLSFFTRKPWLDRFYSGSDPLFALDALRKMQFGRFFLYGLPENFPASLAFLSGAGGIFFSSYGSVPKMTGLSKALEFFALVRRQSSVAVLCPEQLDFLPSVRQLHYALCSSGFRPDMIQDFDYEDYALIFTPFVSGISPQFVSRLFSFAENGGVWVLGPCLSSAGFGSVKRSAGVYPKKEFSGLSAVSALWEDGTVFSGTFPVEGYYPDQSDWVFQESLSLIKYCRIGRGTILFLGAFPIGDSLTKLIDRVLRLSGFSPFCPDRNLVFAEFSGALPNGDPLCFTAAYSSLGREVLFPAANIDLLSGHAVIGPRILEADRLYLLKNL